MRTWGRSGKIWVQVITDDNGEQDQIWLTTFLQALQLILGESPFHADYGLPAQQTIVSQVFPDYYVNRMKQAFTSRFAALSVARVPGALPPAYAVSIVSHTGVQYDTQIEVPA